VSSIRISPHVLQLAPIRVCHRCSRWRGRPNNNPPCGPGGSLRLSLAGNRVPSRRVSPLPGPDRVRRLSRLGSLWLGRPASPLSSLELVRRPSRAGGHLPSHPSNPSPGSLLSHHPCRADSPLLDLLVHPPTGQPRPPPSSQPTRQPTAGPSCSAQNSSVIPAERQPSAQPSRQLIARPLFSHRPSLAYDPLPNLPVHPTTVSGSSSLP
jgi:hypothetical protein